MNTNRGLLIKIENPTIIDPKKREPVSPMKIFAGCLLKIKNETKIPTRIELKKAITLSLNKKSATKENIHATLNPTELASPSIPSVKLTAFTNPHSVKKAKI